MDSAKLNDWMQVIGIFAVVASLIFVGLQMKQSHEIALASQYQARAEAALSLFETHIEAKYTMPPFLNKVTDTFTVQDIAQAQWQWTALDNHYFQYQKGFLEEDAWLGLMLSGQLLYGACHARFVWEARKNGLRPELVALVESWEDNC